MVPKSKPCQRNRCLCPWQCLTSFEFNHMMACSEISRAGPPPHDMASASALQSQPVPCIAALCCVLRAWAHCLSALPPVAAGLQDLQRCCAGPPGGEGCHRCHAGHQASPDRVFSHPARRSRRGGRGGTAHHARAPQPPHRSAALLLHCAPWLWVSQLPASIPHACGTQCWRAAINPHRWICTDFVLGQHSGFGRVG